MMMAVKKWPVFLSLFLLVGCGATLGTSSSIVGKDHSQLCVQYETLLAEFLTAGPIIEPAISDQIIYTADEAIKYMIPSMDWSALVASASCTFSSFDVAISQDTNGDGDISEAEFANVQSWINVGAVTSYQIVNNTDGASFALDTGTNYYFSVRSQDSNGNISTPVSSTAWQVNATNSAYNVAAAESTVVVSLEDNNTIWVNGSVVGVLNAGETISFASSAGMEILAPRPFFAQGNVSNTHNVSYGFYEYRSTNFSFANTRNGAGVVRFYALEDGVVTLNQGGTATGDTATLSAGESGSFNIPTVSTVAYELNSTGNILAFVRSSTADGRTLLPPSNELLGYDSNSSYLTAISTTGFTAYASSENGGATDADTVNLGTADRPNIPGAGQYAGAVSRFVAVTSTLSGRSQGDGDGSASGVFIPTSLMKNRYAIPADADWMAFASTSPATIQVYDENGSPVTSFTLTRTGSQALAPYDHYLTANINEGYRYESSSSFAAWYQPTNDAVGVEGEDETLLYGANN